eukprot:3941586-Rhodomonas_salina.4
MEALRNAGGQEKDVPDADIHAGCYGTIFSSFFLPFFHFSLRSMWGVLAVSADMMAEDDLLYGVLPAYAISGTDVGTSCYAMSGADVGYAICEYNLHQSCGVLPLILPRTNTGICSAIPGADLGYDATARPTASTACTSCMRLCRRSGWGRLRYLPTRLLRDVRY